MSSHSLLPSLVGSVSRMDCLSFKKLFVTPLVERPHDRTGISVPCFHGNEAE